MKNERNNQTDEFESLLQRLELANPPAQWRNEILGAARRTNTNANQVEAGSHDVRHAAFVVGLRRLIGCFAPSRSSWACLAGLWLVILSLHVAARDEAGAQPRTYSVSDSAFETSREHLKQQRLLMVELIGDIKEAKPAKPKPLHPGHRSQRREETALV